MFISYIQLLGVFLKAVFIFTSILKINPGPNMRSGNFKMNHVHRPASTLKKSLLITILSNELSQV